MYLYDMSLNAGMWFVFEEDEKLPKALRYNSKKLTQIEE